MKVLDLGVMGYLDAWEVQKAVHEGVLAGEPDTLILVEHPPVLTLGANFHDENLLFSEAQYTEKGIEVIRTDRGGDVTYHGPGQLVQYPIFDLNRHGRDLHRWMRDLEETQLHVLRSLGIVGRRFPPNTGAWLENKKVAAIGVKVKRWTSLHGIALNCDLDLSVFDLIVPCGIQGYGVTSLSECVGRRVSVAETKPWVIAAFQEVFDGA